MKDRFKFRAWDQEKKKMLFNIALTPEGFGEHHPNFDWPEVHLGINNEVAKNWIPMQCTGLRDEKGTLIFEGDIIRDTESTVNKIVKYERDYEGDGRPYSGFVIDTYDVIGQLSEDNMIRSVEIIGNIYENPDLLN